MLKRQEMHEALFQSGPYVILCQNCVHENSTFKSGDESFCRLMPVSFWLMLLVLCSRALS